MGGGRNEDKVGKGGEGFVNNRQIWVNMRREILFVFAVTPCVGVWIEIWWDYSNQPLNIVTPCVGVWIEIDKLEEKLVSLGSLPVWECGLK